MPVSSVQKSNKVLLLQSYPTVAPLAYFLGAWQYQKWYYLDKAKQNLSVNTPISPSIMK